jgi:hypothetical protein
MVRIRFDISMGIRFCSRMNILIGPMTPPVHGRQGRQRYVEGRIGEISGVDYAGAVYDHQKASFFSSVDPLAFPARYPHEPQPFVVDRAGAASIPVAASNGGCIQ